jgi:exodeoxyribonuclease VII large subunit
MDLFSSHLRLSDINALVSEVISDAFQDPLWIVAEVASISSAGAAGHTYLELVEKRGDEIVAQARAQIWRTRRETLLQFERITRRKLVRGMQVLFLGQPTFHARYGYSLDIRELDPNFTLGDMARRRQEVIERLAASGLLDRNRSLELPPAPQRIAVISSQTAAGWDDFARRLAQNAYGFAFYPQLFPAQMQGDSAETSITTALAAIKRSAAQFDCVLILRGGGGTVDLSCFDGYLLASAIAQFPLPVICGIGHDRDQSICDMVAHISAPTPTAAAEFLIASVLEFEETVLSLMEQIEHCAGALLDRAATEVLQLANECIAAAQDRLAAASAELLDEIRVESEFARAILRRGASDLANLTARVELLPSVILKQRTLELASTAKMFALASRRALDGHEHELQTIERDVRRSDPAEVLRRGYSITHKNGRILRDPTSISDGDRIETILHLGRLESVVTLARLPESEAGERIEDDEQ